MEGIKTRIFLTGATGVMGMAGLKEFIKYPGRYDISVLARNSKINRKKLKPFENKGIKIIWGDLLDEKSLRRGIENCDIILHVGGMVSPLADLYPEKTMKVNLGSMQLITKIIKELEDKDKDREIKMVFIGSVSQYGSKLPPNHWGSATDTQNPAIMDSYAESKVLSEKTMKEAGLKKWVSIRQTGILHSGLLKNATNPVAFHTPINGVLEWITTEDSGRLLERICRKEVPDDFWGKCYNAGGGEPFRLTNYEFEKGILQAMGCPAPEKIFEPKWFATRNFHGMWFDDSDDLDEILHFREKDDFLKALERMKKELPGYFKLAPLAPAFIIKWFMKRVASKPGLGPLSWIKENDEEKIKVFWGGREEYEKITDWKKLKKINLPKATPKRVRKNN